MPDPDESVEEKELLEEVGRIVVEGKVRYENIHIFSFHHCMFRGRKNYQEDGSRRGYDPEEYSRLFWNCQQEEEKEER